MKLFPLTVCIILSLFVISCSNYSPREAANGYLDNINKNNWSKACDFVEKKSKDAIAKATSLSCEEYLEKNQQDSGGIYRPIYIDIQGHWATVNSARGDLYLRKSEGSWRISWTPPEWLLEKTGSAFE